nr:PQQ-binding-like beta-propeller repeat protein [Pseudenhygromyxa sp. WMMC2535]
MSSLDLADAPLSLACSPDGRWVATTGDDKKLRVRDARTLDELEARHVGRRPAALCFSPDSQRVAAGATGLTTWDTSSWKRAQAFKGHKRDVARAVFSPEGTKLYSGGSSDKSPFDNTLRCWDAATGAELQRWEAQGSICALALSPDGASLAVATTNGQTMLLDTETCTPRWTDPPEARTSALAFASDGRLFGTLDHALLFTYDLATGAQQPLVPALRYGTALAISQDATAAFVACGSGGAPEGAVVAAIDLSTGSVTSTAALGPAALPRGVALSPDGQRLYVAHTRPNRLVVFER